MEKGFPGVSLGKKEDMMGQRASYTCDINMDEAEIPVANRLGEEGTGFYLAMRTFQHTRPAIAAGAVGVSQCALDHSLRYSLERKTFGTFIGITRACSSCSPTCSATSPPADCSPGTARGS